MSTTTQAAAKLRPPKPPRLHKMTSEPADIPLSSSSPSSSSLSSSFSQNFIFSESYTNDNNDIHETPPTPRRAPPEPPTTKLTPPTNKRTPPGTPPSLTPPTNKRASTGTLPFLTPPTNKRTPPGTPPHNKMTPPSTPPVKKNNPPPTPPNKPPLVPSSPSHSTIAPPPTPPNKPPLVPSSHSAVAPPPTPPFKPNGKPATSSISSSLAAKNISRAINKHVELERKRSNEEKDEREIERGREEERDQFIVIDKDLSTHSRRTVSLIGDQLEITKKGVASKPKLIPNNLPPTCEATPTFNEATPIASSSAKRPMLPPTSINKSSVPPRPNLPPRPLGRSSSSGTPPSYPIAPPIQSPIKTSSINKSYDRPLSYIEVRSKRSLSEERGGEKISLEDPISPLSVSSGIPEDEEVLSSPNSRQTTPSCITCSESVVDELADNRGNELASIEETDGRKTKNKDSDLKKTEAVKLPPQPPTKAGVNLPKVRVKDDNSWIQRQRRTSSESPPTSPPTLPPQKTALTSTTSVPFRSHAILNLGEKRQSSVDSLLKDPSRPMIGPSGQYYPPAVRSITPDPPITRSVLPTTNEEKEEEKEEKEESGKVSAPKVPSRFLKNRRSNSFSGASDKKIRPVSMVDNFSSKRDMGEANGRISESTIEDTKQGRKLSPKNRMSVKEGAGGGAKRRGVFGLFKSRQKIEERGEEERVKGGDDSSEDETGGTIKRMPKTLDRSNPHVPEYSQLFQYVIVMELKEDPDTKKLTTHKSYQFPPPPSEIDKEDRVILDSIGQFCFPDIQLWKPVLTYKSETFSFVLTSIDGSRRFGYCRRLLPEGKGPRFPEVFCIISPLGCFDLYSKILDIVEERRAVSLVAVFSLLKSIIANPFPAPGQSVFTKALPAKDGTDLTTIRLKRPPDSRLEHVDFCHLYNTLGPKKLLKVFSSLLMERRVILSAQRLSTLSSCGHALLALLYPFEWQHTFIPVLPNELIDFCASPLPYIIGISPVMVKKLDHLEIEMEEALVVDLDKRKFVKKFGDEESILPNKVSQYLLHMLEATVIKNEYSRSDRRGKSRADEKIVNSFMTVFAYFFGEYKKYMITIDRKTGQRELQKKEFVDSFHSKSTKRFLNAFMMTQMFDKWIEERENPHKLEAVGEGLFEKNLLELKERTQEIEIFSSRRRFPWQRRH